MKRCVLFVAALFIARTAAQAQSSTPADSVFDAELMKLLVQQSQRTGARPFPSLTLSAQYARHRQFDDQPVYQRGPYELTEQIFRSSYTYHLTLNAEPKNAAAPGQTQVLVPTVPMRSVNVAPAATPWYVCGMIVRAPQVGEVPDVRSAGGEYLVRVAAIPVRYANDSLWLLTLLQRARATTGDGRPASQTNAVVYKKLIHLHGSESLTLVVPPEDPSDPTVEEVTISHETPQGFGLAQNVPNPVESRTMFAYALPSQSNVQLLILKPDGTPVDTLVRGYAEAGVYRAMWDASNVPPGSYQCAMEAMPTAGGAPFLKQVTVTRASASSVRSQIPMSADSVAELFPIATIPLEQQHRERIFRLMVEGGAAYLDPRKASSPFDNMFSHVAIGVGFALTPSIDVGMMFGQDAFHSLRENVNPIIVPSTDEAVETHIVPWAGGFTRIYFSTGFSRGFFHASAASATGGLVSTFGIGFTMTLASGLSLYVMPHRTDQWQTHVTTKWGADYGIAFLF